MEVGTGTTDASMDEWLQVCITPILAFFEFVVSSFSFSSSLSKAFPNMYTPIPRELRTPNPNPTNRRRRSRRALPTSPLQVAIYRRRWGKRAQMYEERRKD